MNGNSDKHNKPLSTEELFRLLETKEQETFAGDDLDDFEKEALEGFSAHTSAEKARQLTEEVHQSIHAQVGEKRNNRPIGRIIWFSAAASVMLTLVISAYFLAQEAKVSEELALNKEINEKMNAMPETAFSELPAVVPAEEQEKETKEESKKESKPQLSEQEATISQKQGPLAKTAAGSGSVANDKQDDANRLKNEAQADVSMETTTKDEAKKSTASSDTKSAEVSEQENQKAGYATTNGFSSPNKAATAEDRLSAIPAEEKAQKQSPVTTYESVAVTGKTKMKQPSQKRKEADADKERSPATTATGSTNMESGNATITPAGNASYAGGERAVKNYVIQWFKEHQYGIPDKGSYTIRLKVFANGSVETLGVKAGTQADEALIEPLKKALDTMKGWNPAMVDQHAADSETVLTLSF